MKRIIVVLVVLLTVGGTSDIYSQSWLKKLGKTAENAAKRAVENTVERKVEQKTERTVEKAFDGELGKDSKIMQEKEKKANSTTEQHPLPGSSTAVQMSPKQESIEISFGKIMSPQDIIDNAPALPSAEEWVKNMGHTESFKNTINALKNELAKVVNISVSNIGVSDLEAMKAQQMRDMESAQQSMEQAAKGMEMMGMLMKKLNLTEDDMEKLSKMSDEESEAFIKKRMQESGLQPNDIAAMASSVGLDSQPKSNPDNVDVNAIVASQEATQTFMEKMRQYDSKANDWETDAKNRLQIQYDKYQASRPKNIYGLDDLMTRSVTQEQYDAQQRLLIQLENDLYAESYRIWSELILNCQGELKILMQYAVAADQAKAKMQDLSGDSPFGTFNRIGNNAISVAQQYLRITESEPKLN